MFLTCLLSNVSYYISAWFVFSNLQSVESVLASLYSLLKDVKECDTKVGASEARSLFLLYSPAVL